MLSHEEKEAIKPFFYFSDTFMASLVAFTGGYVNAAAAIPLFSNWTTNTTGAYL